MSKHLAQTVADAASLMLTAPAALVGVLCSCRSGGFGVGWHSTLHGCRIEAGDALGVEVVITAFEVALLVTFCGLQTVRLICTRMLRDRLPLSLLLNILASALLLTACSVLAVNNPHSLLYNGPFTLLLAALPANLAGLGFGIAAVLRSPDRPLVAPLIDDYSTELQPPSPMPVNEFVLGMDETLLFADEDSLVYEFCSDGRMEWRLGTDRGGNPKDSNSRPSCEAVAKF